VIGVNDAVPGIHKLYVPNVGVVGCDGGCNSSVRQCREAS